MTGEVNAAVRGAKAAGAGHHRGGLPRRGRLLQLQESDPRTAGGWRDVRAGPRLVPVYRAAEGGLRRGAARRRARDGWYARWCDVPYRQQRSMVNAWINDQLAGESGIEAAICGVWDTPVVFVAGDDATCREVTELLGEKVTTAPVKTGLGRYSARTLSHSDACDLIERRVTQALTSKDWPRRTGPPAR